MLKCLVAATAAVTLLAASGAEARPLVRQLMSIKNFDELMKHHAEKTGFPVIVDYYSDGCGPCRQIAPFYKQLAKQYKNKVIFTKVNVDMARDISSRQQIRSMPTFQFYLGGKKKHQFSGADTNSLQQWAQRLADDAVKFDVQVTEEALIAFYKEVAPEKAEDVDGIRKILAKTGEGGGPAHYKLVRKLAKKYDGKKPETIPNEHRIPQKEKEKKKKEEEEAAMGPRLTAASIDDLKAELAKRIEEADEADDDDDDEDGPAEFVIHTPGDFPERVAIIGGGPAGLAAAIYAARAGLRPVVVAPPMGGQLQGKGVMVENYPAVTGVTGPTIVADMLKQASEFGTVFDQNLVLSIEHPAADADGKRPFVIKTNFTEFKTHTIVLATGADSRWLGVEGEELYRGGGVSSCATCDGFLYKDQHVVVVGGGDTAMEDALVLARTSSKVTVIHRRDAFRASHVLAQRVLTNDKIEVRWNAVVTKFEGEKLEIPGDDEGTTDTMDSLTKVHIKDTVTDEASTIECNAAFVAIGHIPNTGIVESMLPLDAQGYVSTKADGSTYTDVPGLFAAGDVSDKVYRQAITSAGSGAMAALDSERWLSHKGIGDEEAEFEAELLREMLAETPEREESTYVNAAGAKEEAVTAEQVKRNKSKAADEAAGASADEGGAEADAAGAAAEEILEDDDGIEVVEEHTEL